MFARIALLFVCSTLLHLPAAETASISLLTPDLSGWDFVAGAPGDIHAVCTARPDGVIAVAGTPNGYLGTQRRFRNYELKVEWRWPGKPGNAGILVHLVGGPKDRVWPESFQIQTKSKAVGDLLPMAGVQFKEPLTSPTGATPARARLGPDSERPPGEWNQATIICRDGSIDVFVNGVRQNQVTGCSPDAGAIGLQLEGTPYEVRNLSLTPFD